jgi:hypothetical protein
VSDVVPTPEVAEVVQVAAKDTEETVVAVPVDKDRASAAVLKSAQAPTCCSSHIHRQFARFREPYLTTQLVVDPAAEYKGHRKRGMQEKELEVITSPSEDVPKRNRKQRTNVKQHTLPPIVTLSPTSTSPSRCHLLMNQNVCPLTPDTATIGISAGAICA